MTVRIQRNPQAVWRAIKAFGTQEKLADHLGVRQTDVSAWGKGDRPVPFHFCVRIERDTRKLAAAKRDQALVVKCEELQPSFSWQELLELAKLRLAAGAA